jgi:hypothetical protein
MVLTAWIYKLCVSIAHMNKSKEENLPFYLLSNQKRLSRLQDELREELDRHLMALVELRLDELSRDDILQVLSESNILKRCTLTFIIGDQESEYEGSKEKTAILRKGLCVLKRLHAHTYEETRAVTPLVFSEARGDLGVEVDDAVVQRKILKRMTQVLEVNIEPPDEIGDHTLLWKKGSGVLARSCLKRALEKISLQGIKIYSLQHAAGGMMNAMNK